MNLDEFLEKMKAARATDPLFQVAKAKADQLKEGTSPLEPVQNEQEYFNDLNGAVIGSLIPGKKIEAGQMALQALPEAETLLTRSAVKSAPNSLAMETQKAARAVDFAARNKYNKLKNFIKN